MSKKIKEAPKTIENLNDLKQYLDFYGVKYIIMHPIWKNDGKVQTEVSLKATVEWDKRYSRNALKYWINGDSRQKNYVLEDNVEFTQEGKSIYIQVYKVGQKFKFTLL